VSHTQTLFKCKQQRKASLRQKLSIFLLGTASVIVGMEGVAEASALFNPATGHHYEFVSGSLSWSDAKAAAETRFYNGFQGYLTTVTSQAENDFLFSNWGNFDHVWLGASDAEQEGVWKWMTGPEAGTVFWQNGIPNGYNNWSSTEPNNVGGIEDYVEFNSSAGGRWNDVPHNHWISNLISGYFVEYNAPQATVPEPSSMLGLLVLGVFGTGSLLKRKQQQQVLRKRLN